MFQKVLRYTGRHRKTTYASILVLVAGVAMSVLPYFFLYRLLRPLLTGGSLTLEAVSYTHLRVPPPEYTRWRHSSFHDGLGVPPLRASTGRTLYGRIRTLDTGPPGP